MPADTPDSLDTQIARHTLEELRPLYRSLLLDTVDDDTRIRELAKRVLPEDCVDGDSYGVPGVIDIVEYLVQDVENLRAKVEGMERAATLSRARHLAKHGHDR